MCESEALSGMGGSSPTANGHRFRGQMSQEGKSEGELTSRFGRLPPGKVIQFKRKGPAHIALGGRSLSPAECLQEPATFQLRMKKEAGAMPSGFFVAPDLPLGLPGRNACAELV